MQNFQKDDLVWFVDYLDKARHHITLSHSTLKLASRLSTVSILWVPLLASAYVNSEAYAQLTQRSQCPIRFISTFLPLALIRSPLAASVRCIVAPLMPSEKPGERQRAGLIAGDSATPVAPGRPQ